MSFFTLPPFLEWLTPEVAYVSLSALIALLIWLEGQMLKKSAGKLPESKLFHVSSLLDTFWFFISVLAFYYFDLNPLALAVPAAYGIYTVFGWVYGTRLLKRQGMPDSPKELVIPNKYIAYSQSFALIFFGLCVFVLVTTSLPVLPLAA